MTSRHHRTSGGQQQNDEEIIHAVGNRGGKSAYDKMMAEIQIDSDGDDFGKDLSRRAQEKNYRKQLSSSSSFTPNNRDTMSSKKIVKGEDDDEEKVYQDHKRTSKMQAEPITTNNSPLSDSDSRVNSGKRRLSLPSSPPILSKLERRNSKSHNSDGEGDHSDDSDDSAHETEGMYGDIY
jgi:hypothetical protein